MTFDFNSIWFVWFIYSIQTHLYYSDSLIFVTFFSFHFFLCSDFASMPFYVTYFRRLLCLSMNRIVIKYSFTLSIIIAMQAMQTNTFKHTRTHWEFIQCIVVLRCGLHHHHHHHHHLLLLLLLLLLHFFNTIDILDSLIPNLNVF